MIMGEMCDAVKGGAEFGGGGVAGVGPLLQADSVFYHSRRAHHL